MWCGVAGVSPNSFSDNITLFSFSGTFDLLRSRSTEGGRFIREMGIRVANDDY